MLSEEYLNNVEHNAPDYIHFEKNGMIRTLRELVSEIRTLQQQNKQMKETLEEMAESPDDWYVSRTPMKEFARRAIQSLQGGKSNDPTDHRQHS